jgi:hypothetical protein
MSRSEMEYAEPNSYPKVVGLGHCAHDILAITPGLPDFDAVKAMHLADLVHDGWSSPRESVVARCGLPGASSRSQASR